MKIEKLLTLSQFVEYLYSEYEPYNKDTLLNAHKAECFDLTVNYMQFLKQPLKKEMFVNEGKEPSRYQQFKHGKFLLLSKENLEICHEYEGLENGIIFKNVEIINDPHAFNVIINDKWQMLIFKSGAVHLNNINDFKSDTNKIKTLYDLSEETNCEFELQNVEL